MDEQMSEQIEGTLELAEYFGKGPALTFVYHTLLKKLTKGANYGRLYRKLREETPFFPYHSLKHPLDSLEKKGLVKIRGNYGSSIYEAIPIKNPTVREVIQRHKNATRACIELEEMSDLLSGRIHPIM